MPYLPVKLGSIERQKGLSWKPNWACLKRGINIEKYKKKKSPASQ